MGSWLAKSRKVEVETNMPNLNLRLKSVSTSPRITRSPEQLERDERVRIKKHIHKVLNENYDWDNAKINDIIEIFTVFLSKDKNKIELAWKNWRLKSYEKIFKDNLVIWNPSIYEDESNLTYANLYPCIINQIEGNPIVGYNRSSQKWSGIFKLDFLPLDVNDIIASDGGLLCINGGLQPRTTNPQTPPIPYSEDYNYTLYPQQSILLVCNPLTKEIKFIPRHTNKILDNKIAWMTIMINPKKIDLNKANSPKQRYRLYVVGSHEDVPKFCGNGCDELVLMAYDSRSDSWIFGSIVGQCRFPKSGKTGIAIFDEGFMIGGQEKSTIDVEKTKKANIKSNYVNNSLNEYKTLNFKPQIKPSYLWKNKLFFVHHSSLKWHTLDFEILDTEGFPRENLEAPRILQCEPRNTIYVATRSIVNPSTIEIHEVLMSNGYPSGDFLFTTMMPSGIYKSLFRSEKSLKRYDCCAGSQLLCFLALNDKEDDTKYDKKVNKRVEIKNNLMKSDQKNTSKNDRNTNIKKKRKKHSKNVATLAIFNIKTKKWSILITPNLNNESSNCSYALAKCSWTPNWLTRP